MTMLQNIELLCQLRHPNIASLIGFCNHKKKNKIVVQEYISNGSLSQHLPGGDLEALSWKKRLEICIYRSSTCTTLPSRWFQP